MAQATKQRSRGSKKAPNSATSTAAVLDEPDLQELDIDEEMSLTEPDTTKEATATDPRRIPRTARFNFDEGSDFFTFVAQFPEPADLDVYVYRLFPVIKVMPPTDWAPGTGRKPPTHIEKLKGAITPQTNRVFDLDWLRNIRGSGKYHIRLLDRSLMRTKNRQICEGFIEVNDWDTNPPVFNDWSELVPCDANRWFIERLLKDRVIKRTPEGRFMPYEGSEQTNNTAAGGNGDPAVLLDKALNFAERAYSRANQSKPNDTVAEHAGIKAMDILSNTIQNVMKETKTPAPDNTLFTVLMEEVRETRKELAEERRAFRELLTKQQTAPPSDAETQLTKTLDLLSKVKEHVNGDSAEPRHSKMAGWQEMVQPLFQGIAPGVNILLQGIGTAFMRGPQPRPTTVSTTATPAGQPTPAALPDGSNAAEPHGNPDMNQIDMMLQQIAPSLMNHLTTGATGEEFGDWLVNGYGAQAIQAARAIGKERMLLWAKNNAQLWAQVQPIEERFLLFVDQFLGWTPPTEDDEPGEPDLHYSPPEPAPAPARKRAKK